MKKIILLTSLVAFFIMGKPAETTAQVRVHVNIGMQPAWGPAGYERAEYYYLPDIDVYYDVYQRSFVYFDEGRWMFGMELPYRFRGYDIYRGYKVVINERDPWLRCDYYRRQFAPYRNYYGHQPAIQYRRDYYSDDDRRYDDRRRYDNDRRYDDDAAYERHNNNREKRDNDDYAQNRGRENGRRYEHRRRY